MSSFYISTFCDRFIIELSHSHSLTHKKKRADEAKEAPDPNQTNPDDNHLKSVSSRRLPKKRRRAYTKQRDASAGVLWYKK